MRTTLAIDDDVLAAARNLAKQENKTVGEVISMLARQGLSRPVLSTPLARNGLPLLPTKQGGAPVTFDLVNRLCGDQL